MHSCLFTIMCCFALVAELFHDFREKTGDHNGVVEYKNNQ
jgi:hypothetical protein